MKYAPILELLLTHTFYADGRCPDLAIEPSAETARVLQRHRCVLRSLPGGVRVITALDGSTGQPSLPLPQEGAALHFHLTLENSDFALFTDLTGINLTGIDGAPKPLFTNAGMAAGSAGELELVPSTAARRPGIFADVEIHLSGQGLGPEIATFSIAFRAKEVRWAYYCVTPLSLSADDLRIEDASPTGTADKLLFGAENRTKLNEQPDPMDPVAAELERLHPGMRRVRMVSDIDVACREAPRKYLELWHGNERLSSPLPNPSVRRVSRMSALQQKDVLFHVVKYRADPFYNP